MHAGRFWLHTVRLVPWAMNDFVSSFRLAVRDIKAFADCPQLTPMGTRHLFSIAVSLLVPVHASFGTA
jgi:hypothetical protein